jgi:hypothetical protein
MSFFAALAYLRRKAFLASLSVFASSSFAIRKSRGSLPRRGRFAEVENKDKKWCASAKEFTAN